MHRNLALSIAGLALVAVLACSTTPSVWSDRVGVYTYTEAVRDYGDPRRLEDRHDEGFVATWPRFALVFSHEGVLEEVRTDG